MDPTPADLARAMSGHDFDAVIPHLAERIEWDLVGEATLRGRDDVIAALRGTQEALAQTRTEFSRFVVVAEGSRAVVDSVAEYADASGDSTRVASCDIYEFSETMIVAVRSYNVELP